MVYKRFINCKQSGGKIQNVQIIIKQKKIHGEQIILRIKRFTKHN